MQAPLISDDLSEHAVFSEVAQLDMVAGTKLQMLNKSV